MIWRDSVRVGSSGLAVARPCQGGGGGGGGGPGGGGGGGHVARLNFKTPCVGVYKCLSLIVGFAVTVAIWPREVVSCRDFILHAVATFWAMLLVEIYPSRASVADPGRGSGGSRCTPIRPDTCLRLKFLH